MHTWKHTIGDRYSLSEPTDPASTEPRYITDRQTERDYVEGSEYTGREFTRLHRIWRREVSERRLRGILDLFGSVCRSENA